MSLPLAAALAHHQAVFRPALAARSFSAAPSAEDALRTAYGYCVQQVKTHDADNYSWVVQAPKVGVAWHAEAGLSRARRTRALPF